MRGTPSPISAASAVPSAAGSGPHRPEPETLEELRGDCRRIDASWTRRVASAAPRAAAAGSRAPATDVPAGGARLVAGMSVYGD